MRVEVSTPDHVSPHDHGAVGDGVHDDGPAIRAAITSALARGQHVQLEARTYCVSEPIVLGHFLSLRGAHRAGDACTTIKAIAPMRAVLELHGGLTYRLADLSLDANRQADHALLLIGCSFGEFDRITVSRARADGIYLAKRNDAGGISIDDANVWRFLQCFENGTLYLSPSLRSRYVIGEGTPRVSYAQAVSVLGSVSLTAGSNVLSFEGTDVASLALRPGDPVYVENGGRDHFLVVETLSATELRVGEPATLSATGCAYAIGRGDGYHEEEGDGDNNTSTFESGLWRCNAGKALQIQGSYGCRMFGGFVEYCPFWGILVGCATPDYMSTSISPLFIGTYFEAVSRKPFYLQSAIGLRMDGLVAPDGTDCYDTPHFPNTPFVRGIRIGDRGIEPIGQITSSVPATRTMNASLEGSTKLYGEIVQPWPAHGRFASSYLLWRSSGADVVLDGTPTLAIEVGKLVIVQNAGDDSHSLTLQDEAVLPGSKLRLASPTLVLEPKQSVMLICNGTYWSQVRT